MAGTLRIKVKHGVEEHEVVVPSSSTFEDLKKAIEKETRLPPSRQRLIFRGRLVEDGERLSSAGVKNRTRLLLMEIPEMNVSDHRGAGPEGSSQHDGAAGVSAKEGEKGEESGGPRMAQLRKVRDEVDKLQKQVDKIRADVASGVKVEGKEFVVVVELLMQQLLRLDGISVEGSEDARAMRKAEVKRIQGMVDAMDSLKPHGA